MSSELTIFENEQFGSIRTVKIDSTPYFVGKDVAEVLGYSNPQKAIRDHVDDEDKGVNEMDTPGGKQNIAVINESGLYSLILSSKLPKAKEFKHWVTSEVLPAIRRHGMYGWNSCGSALYCPSCSATWDKRNPGRPMAGEKKYLLANC